MTSNLRTVQTQAPQALVRDMLRSSSLGTCMETMLRFVSRHIDQLTAT